MTHDLSAERIASIQRCIDQSHAGQTRPAREVLAELGLDPWESPMRPLPLSADSVRLAAEYARRADAVTP